MHDPLLHLVTTLTRMARMAGLTSPPARNERGDVPGWVLITVMTAMLVGVIGTLAKDQLSQLLTTALHSVTG